MLVAYPIQNHSVAPEWLINWKFPPSPSNLLNTNSSSLGNQGVVGCGAILRRDDVCWHSTVSEFIGQAWNMQAELMTLQKGLELA